MLLVVGRRCVVFFEVKKLVFTLIFNNKAFHSIEYLLFFDIVFTVGSIISG